MVFQSILYKEMIMEVWIKIAMKNIFVSAISAIAVSMLAVGGSVIVTFLYVYLNGENTGQVITTSRVIWFSIISVLSFLYLYSISDKEYKKK